MFGKGKGAQAKRTSQLPQRQFQNRQRGGGRVQAFRVAAGGIVEEIAHLPQIPLVHILRVLLYRPVGQRQGTGTEIRRQAARRGEQLDAAPVTPAEIIQMHLAQHVGPAGNIQRYIV